ncbi:MAG: hypothetical protein K0Q76_2957 [Panacagrimonas sp.]|jgi:uncharacterized protein YjdB|nr:Ig-like domain-containing protein [Panacagrimonas sp.]MCC2657849.1 hypothetical protein [Panacagrimonas sp.]
MRLLRAVLVSLSGLIAVGCGDGGVQSPDFTPELQGIEIAPTAATVAAGRTVQFTAMGTWTLPPGSDTETEQRPVGNVEWTVSNANASIDGDGLATGLQAGTAQITARAEGLESDPVTLTITGAELESIAITPDNPTIPLGSSQVLQATGTFSDGSTAPVSVTWTSSAPTVATVGAGPATSTTAQSVAQGTTTVTGSTSYTPAGSASPVTIQDTVLVTVGAFQPALVTMTVVPDTKTSPVGSPFQFTVTGECTTAPFSPTTGPCTPTNVVWSVAIPTIATIDPTSGIATGQSVGTTSVTATSGTVSDSATFTVVAPAVTSLIITPASASIPVGLTQAFTATAVFSNGVTSPAIVDWTSSTPAVATVAPSNDVNQTTATSVAVGSTTITASMVNALGDTITQTATLTVTEEVLLDLIRVETAAGDPQGRVTPGRSIEFVAIGELSDGTEVQIDDANITWITTNPSIATINASGFATGVAEGTTTVRATRVDLPSDSAETTLTVTDQVCTTPLLASENASITQFATPLCIGCTVANASNVINDDADDFALANTLVGVLGASVGVTATADPPVPGPYTVPFAAGSNAGFIIGKPAGTLVTAEVLSQVIVSTLLNGNVQESTTDGGTPLRLDLLGLQLTGGSETALLSFKTSLEYDAIRLTLNSGTATALADVQIFRACGTAEPPQPAATLVGVARVAPNTATVSVDATSSLTVYGNFSDLTEAQIPDADLDWTSSNPAVATVDANGVVTGVAAGTATITATLKTGVVPAATPRSASAAITVVGNLCATPITAASGATVTTFSTPILCLLCNFSNTGNVIDDASTTFGTMHVPLGLLNAQASITVNSPTSLTVPAVAGFLIARPVGELLQAEVLAQIQVSTLLNGVVQQTSAGPGPTVPLRVDLLGNDVTGGAGSALVAIPATLPYNQLRVTFVSGLLSAGILENLLQTVNVYQACSSVTLPPAP